MSGTANEVYCQIGRLKSGLLWIADEMMALLVVLSIGSMLALAALAYFGNAWRAGQWTSALAALWVASSAGAAATYLTGEATLPCEVRYHGAGTSWNDASPTTTAPMAAPGAGPAAGEPAPDHTQTEVENDARAKERHPDERNVSAGEWTQVKKALERHGQSGQDAIWIGNRWMNAQVAEWRTRVTVRTDRENGRMILRRYHKVEGEERESRWEMKDRETDEVVAEAGESTGE